MGSRLGYENWVEELENDDEAKREVILDFFDDERMYLKLLQYLLANGSEVLFFEFLKHRQGDDFVYWLAYRDLDEIESVINVALSVDWEEFLISTYEARGEREYERE